VRKRFAILSSVEMFTAELASTRRHDAERAIMDPQTCLPKTFA